MDSNTVEIGSICDLQEGYVNPSQKVPEYFDGGIRWLRAVDLNDADVFETSRTLSRKGYESAGKSALMFPANSIGISKSGTIGRLGILRNPMCGNRAVINIVPKQASDLRYIFYSLRMARQSIIAMAVGSVQKNLYVPVLESLTIPWPEQHVRDSIVDIVGSIDDKIAVNARINDYLEQCLLARYDHLFGSTEVYDGTVADIGDVVGGATPSKKKPEYYCQDGIGWITPRDLSNTSDKFIAHGADDITQAGFDSCSVKKLPVGAVLFSSRAPIGYIAITTDEVTTNQGFKSVIPHAEIGTAFVYCFLVRNKNRIAEAGSGTTFPEVSAKTMAGIELTRPDSDLCAKFEGWATPLLEYQRCLEKENRRLRSLRDTLLPKLMSGEIDVGGIV